MCNNCGNSGCGGNCEKKCVKVYKPLEFLRNGGLTGDPGVGIINIVDNFDGTMTIFLSDGSDYTIILPTAPTPDDDWVFVDGPDFIDISFTGTDGATLVGTLPDDGDVRVSYKVNSAKSILVHAVAQFDVLIDDTAPSFQNGTFSFAVQFAAVTSPAGWFAGTKVMESPFSTPYPMTIPVAVSKQLGAGIVEDAGAGQASFRNLGGNNRINCTCRPNLAVSGTYSINLHMNGTMNLT